MGGYRKGSGRSKSGYYKGIYCGSTYELCWVIYSLDHGIKFIRFPGKLEKNGICYYPDFLLEDGRTIIETKGYEPEESVSRKTKVAQSLGYRVKVLRKKDLEYAFEYVRKTYNTYNFWTLYDGYKPKYKFNCPVCDGNFTRDKKPKNKNPLCSRKCSALFNRKKIKDLKANQFTKAKSEGRALFVSEDTKRKWSLQRKGRSHSDSTKEKISQGMKKYHAEK